MRTYKIYGTKYEVVKVTEDAIDTFSIKGELVDDEPERSKLLGYVNMEDGSVVACFKKKANLLKIIGIPILLAVCAVCAYLLYNYLKPQPAIGGTMLETTVHKNVIVFNGIMEESNGTVDVRFVNGNYPATLQIVGEGVKSEQHTIEPNATVMSVPVTLDTKENVVEVKIRISSEGDTAEFNAIIEVPENQTGEVTEGLHGYFDKELIINENQ